MESCQFKKKIKKFLDSVLMNHESLADNGSFDIRSSKLNLIN